MSAKLPSPSKKFCTDQSIADWKPDQDLLQKPPDTTTSAVDNDVMATESSGNASDPSHLLRESDEVAQIKGGGLIFGILEHRVKERDKFSKNDEWKVRWNKCDTSGISTQCPLITTERSADLTFTDRALYKGCKVRSVASPDGLIGICRDAKVYVDFRVLGTATIITGVNIEMFKHLKEFKQKSVVYKSGWLGVVKEVKRLAQVRLVDPNVACEIDLNKIQPVGVLEVEVPWINEEFPGINFAPSQARFAEENALEKLTKKAIKSVFIEDLKVESVKVQWRYQVDAMRPDKPPQSIVGTKLKDLQIVMEELSSDAGFQVGNLGRFKITSQTEFVNYADYSSQFALANMGEDSVTKLASPFPKPRYAYDPDPEKKLTPDTTVAVEIVHTNTLGDIMWQDGRMDWQPGKKLIVQPGSLLDNVLTPGDFLFSNELKCYGTAEEVYAVVTRYDLKEKKVTVKVLTCDSPPKLLTTLCLSENSVVPHSRYKYFNQPNTVVVMLRDERTCVGHVRRTNLDGKIQCLWLHNSKEDWVWPAECSVYNVKGHDLDCIISLINDDDEVKEVDLRTKFLRLNQRIRKISEIWNEVADEAAGEASLIKLRSDSVADLRTILLECRHIEEEFSVGQPNEKKLYSDETVSDFSVQIGKLIDENRSGGDSNNNAQDLLTYTRPDLVETVIALCTELLTKGKFLELKFEKTDDGLRSLLSSDPMDTQPLPCTSALTKVTPIDVKVKNLPTDGSPSCPIEIEGNEAKPEDSIFDSHVAIEDCCPEGHIYAQKIEFQPTQIQHFIKIVRNELNNLRDQCPPGIKVKAYGDRYDLFSIMIRGPINTPYENSIYLFDAILPPTYPAVPPKFHFHSYRAGRLNPNLYAEGLVCVSLLGTWSSPNHQEKWTQESNLVQVLLSIQALILVSEPYHNEPGLEADKYTTAEARQRCRSYNDELLPKIMTMIANQIEYPMAPWKEEIKIFYKGNLPALIARWERWLEVASKATSREDFLVKLGDDKPEFEIYPIGKKDAIQGQLIKLKQLHEKLMQGGDGEHSNLEVGEAQRAEEASMAGQEPEGGAAMEVDS